MRPPLLSPLFASLASLKGLGDKSAKALGRLLPHQGDVPRVRDALLHLPSNIIDRRLRPKLAEAPLGQTVVVGVVIEEHRAPRRGRKGRPGGLECATRPRET